MVHSIICCSHLFFSPQGELGIFNARFCLVTASSSPVSLCLEREPLSCFGLPRNPCLGDRPKKEKKRTTKQKIPRRLHLGRFPFPPLPFLAIAKTKDNIRPRPVVSRRHQMGKWACVGETLFACKKIDSKDKKKFFSRINLSRKCASPCFSARRAAIKKISHGVPVASV